MKKILIPTDFSDLGDYAYDLANKISASTNAEIHILSVVPATPDVLFDKDGNAIDDVGIDLSKLKGEEKAATEKLLKWWKGKENIKIGKVKIGLVEDDILRYVKENEIDLIVMGTTGSHGLDEFLRGSHAGHISMQAPVPVLSLKCDRSEMEVKDLLFVCDFHEPEKLDLSMLKTLQDVFDAKLNFLKINTKHDFDSQRKIVSKMKEFADLNDMGDVYFHVYCDDNVEQGIVNFCEDTGIDFVTIGTHQRGELSRLFKKSISNQIVKHIWQPVLTFPI